MTEWAPAELALIKSFLPAPLQQALVVGDPAPAAVAEGCARLEATLSGLIPFVPPMVLDFHLQHPDAGRLSGLALTGTVLCADLSEFTTLSSQLARAERQGSEELSALINQLFSALIEEVYAQGGGVIQFGGDALTAFFDAHRLGPSHAQRACAAALAMQARMADFSAVPTSRGPIRLRVRIAVHTGRLFAAEVGDAFHTELVVTGLTAHRVVTAQELAAPGEVLISAQTLEALSGARVAPKPGTELSVLQASPAPPAVPRSPLPLSSALPSLSALRNLLSQVRALQRFVPLGMPDRFVRQSCDGGEFRPVHVLFAQLVDLRQLLLLLEAVARHEEALPLLGQALDTCYTRAQEVIFHYGGSINKVDLAGSGHRLIALFGAPIAHEDDPARAVQAALALRSALDEADRAVARLLSDRAEACEAVTSSPSSQASHRMGLAGGIVFAGLIGTSRRHEYTVMGETVNLAARLMSAAEGGQVLLAARDFRAVSHVVDALPLTPLPLKGFARPVPVVRVMRGRETLPTPRRATPFIGRGQELTRLVELAREALTGSERAGQTVTLIGDPGIGKSRLLQEALHTLEASRPETLVILSACQSFEQPVPYSAAGRLIRRLLRPGLRGDREMQARDLQQRLDALVPAWSRFAPLFSPLFNLSLPETPLTRALTPQQRRDRLHDLAVQVCLAVARRKPLVLAIDDVHWADTSSLAFLRQLAAELATCPVLMLLAGRPNPVVEAIEAAPDHQVRIRLGELEPPELEQMLSAMLEAAPPPELRAVIHRSQGTPLVLEETVRYLRDAGVLRQADGRWQCTRPIDGAVVPSRLEQMVISRLDRLPEPARALAQVAAVIGQRFSVRLLEAVVPELTGLQTSLQELVDASLLQPERSALKSAYQFKHTLFRDAAYGSLLFARRRELHARIAEAIEQLYAHELNHYSAILAQHYLCAELLDRAFPHFLRAALLAQGRYAHTEALALFQQALATAPWRDRGLEPSDLADAAPLFENLADVLSLTGDYPGARRHYHRLLALLARSDGPERKLRVAALQRKMGSTYERQGHLEQALRWFRRAARHVAEAPGGEASSLEHARVLGDLGWICFRQNDLDRAQQYLEAALEQVGSLPVYDELTRLYNRLGGIAYARGDNSLAQHYVERSLASSERSGNLVGQINALSNLGVLTESRGLVDDSIKFSLRAMELSERIGSKRDTALTANNVGWALYQRDALEQARYYLEQAVRLSTEIRDNYMESKALGSLGMVLLSLGNFEQAGQLLERSRLLAQQLRMPGEEIDSQASLAQLALEEGDLERAEREYQRGRELILQGKDEESVPYGRLLRTGAHIRLMRGDAGGASQLLEASEALFQRLHNVPELRRTRALAERVVQAESRCSA